MNKKKWIILISSMVGILAIVLTLTLVLLNVGKKLEVTGISFSSETVTYDGQSHRLEVKGELPEEVKVSYSNNDQTEVGVYVIIAHFEDSSNRYNVPADMEATLTIVKASVAHISLEDKTIPYDGQFHTLEITGELPEGVTVEYQNNSHKNAGVYKVVATFTNANENYEPLGRMEATLRIEQIELDLDSIIFEDTTVTYDGTEKTIEATNLPEGIVVEYQQEVCVKVGSYEITATFKDTLGNYSKLGSKLAVLTIEKGTYDMENVTFESIEIPYDGKEHTLLITGELPAGVTVLAYENNKRTELGSSVAKVSFLGDYENYHPIADMEATLTIIKGTMTFIELSNQTYVYDGTPKKITYSKELPEGIEVTYTNNHHIDAGAYEVLVSFHDALERYEDLTLTVQLTISKATYDMSKVLFEDMLIVYDGLEHRLQITGELPEGVRVRYSTTETLTEVGQLEVTAFFDIDDSKNYHPIPSRTAILTIVPAELDHLVFEDVIVPYDGKVHGVVLEGELPAGVTYEFINNYQIEVGEYLVTVRFNVPNYKNLTATLTITKADIDMSSVHFYGETFIYDGTVHTIEITGVLPEGVKVSYENNSLKDVGSLLAVAKFEVLDTKHYNPIPNLYAEITVIESGLIGISFRDKTVVYNGQPHSIFIQGELPEGVTVTYKNNGQIHAGIYTIIAHFEDTTGNYSSLEDMKAILTIEKASFAQNGIIFKDATYVYDKMEHSILIYCDDLPSEIEVKYENNFQVNAGIYIVTASFIDKNGNYNPVAPVEAVLTIERARINLDHIIFENEYYEYDGFLHTLEIHGELPEEVRVEYSPNSLTKLGRIEVTATFIVDEKNYYPIPAKTAYLTITKGDLEDVVLEDRTVTYDGNAHYLEVKGNLPAGVVVEYTNNEQMDAGVYKVTADFYDDEGYYNSLTATLTILKAVYDLSGITFEDETYDYDGLEHVLEVRGILPEGIVVRYTANRLTNAGSLIVTAIFAGDKNHEEIPYKTAVLTINKISISGLSFKDQQFAYDGLVHSIFVEGLQEDMPVQVIYYNNEQINAGSYTVTATFLLQNENYNPIEEMSATLTIDPISIGEIIFEDASFILDGKTHSLSISTTLPDGVYAEYENNDQIFEGEYTVRMTLKGDTQNYIFPKELTATLRIYSDGSYHMVIFYLDDTTTESRVVADGAGVEDIPVPTNRPGYTGRYTEDLSSITEKTICRPVYEPASYVIYFDTDTVEEVPVVFLNEFVLPIPSKEGYTFKKWVDAQGNDVSSGVYTWTTSITLYAVWQCMVTFQNVNGTIYEELILDSNACAVPKKTYSSYLAGWYLDTGFEQEFDLSLPVLTNQILYAKYEYDYTYQILENEESEILSITDQTKSSYNFMDKIEDLYPVGALSSGLFQGCSNLRKLSLPALLPEVSFGALFGTEPYENSVSVAQREGIYYIPASLEELELQASTIPAFAFYNCTMLKEIHLNNVPLIEGGAFHSCTGLEKLWLTGEVQSISENAFTGCTSLNEVYCDSLAAWTAISFENEYSTPMSYAEGFYVLNDGYIRLTDFTIDLEEIGDYQFYGFSQMERLSLPNAKEIGNQAFTDCTGLSRLDIGGKLQTVFADAFARCIALNEIYFDGSMEDWATINFSNQYATPMWSGATFSSKTLEGAWEQPIMLSLSNTPEIGNYQFYGFKQLKNLKLASVERIGVSAFSGCDALQGIELSSQLRVVEEGAFSSLGITMVSYSGTLEDWMNIEFKDQYSTPVQNDADIHFTDETISLLNLDLTTSSSIGNYQFYGFKTIQSVTLSNTLQEIGGYAFAKCKELEQLAFGSLGSIGIGDSAFFGCSSLKQVHYFGGLENWLDLRFASLSSTPLNATGELWVDDVLIEEATIDQNPQAYQFYGIKNLKKVQFTENVSSIEKYAFAKCKALAEVAISSTISSLGASCFEEDSSLEIIVLTAVVTIPSSCFRGCSALRTISIPKVKTIESYAFAGCSGLSEIDLSAITKLGSNAFSGCRLLVEIQLNNLKVLEQSTFANCYGLEKVTLSGPISQIRYAAFMGCTKLTSLIIPASVTKIDSNAFINNSNLIIYAEATEKPTGWNNNWYPGGDNVFWYSETKKEGNYWHYGADNSIEIWN